MIYTFIAQACTDLPVSACCRVMKVSASDFYAWQAKPASDRDLDDAHLTKHDRRHPSDEPALLWVTPRSRRVALGEGVTFSNNVTESFLGTLQLELPDAHHWQTRQQLALAIFEWIEAWYNPKRRHSYCNMFSPIDYEAAHAA